MGRREPKVTNLDEFHRAYRLAELIRIEEIKVKDAEIERLRELVKESYKEGWRDAFDAIGRDPFCPEDCDGWDASHVRKALENE